MKFKHDLNTWIIVSRQAFLVIEESKFRELIAGLSLDAAELIPSSSNTIRTWIVKEFQLQRDILIEILSQSRSRIHLSLDIWTTPSCNRSYLGIVAHWVDAGFEIRTVLIALPALEDRHTGANIAHRLVEVVDSYGFGFKLGYCMLDSASNNTTAMTEPGLATSRASRAS
jgi:hypothetical protein